MCGIAGLWEAESRVDLGRLHQMSTLLRHRGPDDEGLILVEASSGRIRTLGGPDTPADVFRAELPWSPGRTHPGAGASGASLGLLHRRLSIVDLTPSGHQPLSDSTGVRWITYNGEVYNHVELRAELERLGDRFTGTSDTEVILAAYRRWGHDCLRRLNGMFAFAIWDGERRELFCARDRLGVKPFYYQFDGRSFAFASEPRALALTQPRRILPRLEAVRDLIALDWVDHDAHTCFDGIWQLLPGHFLVLSEKGLGIQRWWQLDPDSRATGTPEDWTRQFESLFTDAVSLRLRADVEVGSCLSGGLDSTAVVTTASRRAPKGMHAFSCAYEEGPSYDERAWIRDAVAASGVASHVVTPDGSDFWHVFDALADRQGEPTAGPGLYSQWKVMELARQAGLKVLLDGQGGDETLGGYFRYLPLRLRDELAAGRIGTFLVNFGPVAARIGWPTTVGWVLEPWLPRALAAGVRRQFGSGKDRVLSSDLSRLGGASVPRPPAAFGSAVRRQMAFDTTQRLLPSLLRYEDRNSMAFSIETRLPFLDYRLVEFAFSLPDSQKLDGVTTKAILRRALKDRIPESILARRDKMGFETPVDVWLRGRFASEARRRLGAPGPLHDWVDVPRMLAALDDHLAGRRGIGLQVWRWLSLESWSRQYLVGDPRRIERAPEQALHAGRHRSFVEVEAEFERETAAAAS
ncbi:MAG TPA: asparagine synthase (glutamine-hydrolyzing) [Candidatus Sulfotelmatobacter sp.]|nr:asparagine synthase (glutamine-hydrolyzing) [Candidatus Sulfotelmatobacter sp.]